MNDSAVDRSARTPTPAGAKLDTVGWGLLLIWVGAALFADVGWPVFFLGTGLMLLGGQAARSHFGLPLGPLVTPAWIVPAAFIAVGVAVVASVWRRRRPRG